MEKNIGSEKVKEIVCGRKNLMLAVKEISLYSSHDREIIEYDFFLQFKVS